MKETDTAELIRGADVDINNIKTTEKGSYDVIVVGGGIAGISAAVAAARQHCSVLLIEKRINLGGLATVGLISWYEPLCDGCGKQVIGGISEELIRLAVNSGFDNLPEKWGGKCIDREQGNRFSSFFSPTCFSLAIERFVIENGVKILFDSLATYPVMCGNHCSGIIVENVSGRELYSGTVIIDATGDALIFDRAGVPCVIGNNYLTYVAHGFDYQDAVSYAEDGNLARFRRWISVGSNYAGNGHPEHIPLFHGDNADEITDFIIKGKEMLWKKEKEKPKDTGELMMIPEIPQMRKIRHIVGETVFTGGNSSCHDSIGTAGDFRKKGKVYNIPYSCLYNMKYDNMLAAGRIISTDDEGWEITRVIPVCALTGQAAGTAASVAVAQKQSVSKIDYGVLKEILLQNRVIFD